MAQARAKTGETAGVGDTDRTDQDLLSVVIPAYNESRNIQPLVNETLQTLHSMDYDHEIVLIDDGSTDLTGATIDELANKLDSVVGVSLTRNHGQSAALAAGIDTARGDVIVTMDADRQNDPADIPALVAGLGDGVACVSGNRADRQDPWHKRLPSWVQTKLAKATGPDIDDFGCTLKAYDSAALDSVTLRGEGHRYIPAMLHDEGYNVTELDVNHRPRTHGESHYGVGRLVRGSVDLLYHWFRNTYGGRPIHLFGGGGAAAMGLGTLIGIVSVVQKFLFGVSLAPRTPRLILTALLIIFGVQLVVFGVLAEMVTDLEHQSDDKSVYRIDDIAE